MPKQTPWGLSIIRCILSTSKARSHYSRQMGVPYADFERSGYWLTVAEIQARYIVPTRYSQQIARCWIDDLKNRTITFAYEIVDTASGQVRDRVLPPCLHQSCRAGLPRP